MVEFLCITVDNVKVTYCHIIVGLSSANKAILATTIPLSTSFHPDLFYIVFQKERAQTKKGTSI